MLVSLLVCPKKFKIIEKDPTLTQLLSLQCCLETLMNPGKLKKKNVINIFLKVQNSACTHDLPNIEKVFQIIPMFRPFIDTIGSYYFVGTILLNLLKL